MKRAGSSRPPTTVKVFIDIFIGVWAFLLAYIWTNHINVEEREKAKLSEIWERFPKVHPRLHSHLRRSF